MDIFHCDHCGQLIFFENVRCVACAHLLAYLPDLEVVGSLEAVGDGLWRSPLPRAAGRTYRLCANYTQENVCNWAVSASDPDPLCQSCRLTRVIPDLSQPGHKEAWFRLEAAKRRLMYTLLHLRLPVRNKLEDPQNGLAFEFLANSGTNGKVEAVLTGHANGVITINMAEADDAERERRRVSLHEPYRTLLGHFRHEIGHYFWDRLLQGSGRLTAFRALFGDERQDYAGALKRHYEQGPPADWQSRYVTAYACAHPWEDWAETWAHYLHMVDTVQTACVCGLTLRPQRKDEPTMKAAPNPLDERPDHFADLMANWFPLTYVLNNLNRGMGLPDGYPFVLADPVIEKLHFVHDTIVQNQ